MRLLHVIGSVAGESGGPIEGVLRQAEVLTALGHTREIVSLDPPGADYLQAFPIKVYPMGRAGRTRRKRPSWVPWIRYGYAPGLVSWIREHAADYDVVIVNGLWNYTAYAAWKALRGSATPYFVFTHGMLDPWFRRTYPLKHVAKQIFWLFSEGKLLRDARCVFFTTEEEQSLAKGAFLGYRYRGRVVGYGTADVGGDAAVQVAAFRAAVPELGSKPFLLFLSRLHRKKGCDLLLGAFKSVASEYPEIDLVMAGPDQLGWRGKLERMARLLGIAERVHWPGMLTGDVKFGAFRDAQAFVLPSHQENFGLVVAEAMACGRPVILSNKVNIWREVVASGGGLVCDASVASLADALRRFLAMDEPARTKMGQAARACFVKHFEVRAAAIELLNVISEMI